MQFVHLGRVDSGLHWSTFSNSLYCCGKTQLLLAHLLEIDKCVFSFTHFLMMKWWNDWLAIWRGVDPASLSPVLYQKAFLQWNLFLTNIIERVPCTELCSFSSGAQLLMWDYFYEWVQGVHVVLLLSSLYWWTIAKGTHHRCDLNVCNSFHKLLRLTWIVGTFYHVFSAAPAGLKMSPMAHIGFDLGCPETINVVLAAKTCLVFCFWCCSLSMWIQRQLDQFMIKKVTEAK